MTGLILHPKRAGLLRALRALLTPKEAWCKGAYARTAGGHSVSSSDESARSFCIIGGINRITEGVDETVRGSLTSILSRAIESICGDHSIPRFNDSATHEEVLSVIDTVIEHVES